MTTAVRGPHTALAMEQRQGIALCLSGGGYRAALFHLGVLTRLNEVGALGLIDTVSSVSGGSILAAHLVTQLPDWPAPGARVPEARWKTAVCEAFQAFVTHDARTKPVLRRFLTPWRVDTAVRVLATEYQNRLKLGRLDATRERPRLIINATDMQFGVDWTFDCGDSSHPACCGDPQAGYTAMPNWPLGLAVAASSCFPPVFNPLRIGPSIGGSLSDGLYPENAASSHPHTAALPPSSTLDPAKLRAQLCLSDGGVYDNLGIGPVWRDHRQIIVSDGGGVFGPARDSGLMSRLKRYEAIASHGGTAVRRQWLLANLESGEMSGTYLAIGSSPEDYPTFDLSYPRDIIRDYVARIRTDLDAFSDAEQAVLINHGYALAAAAVVSWTPEFIQPGTPAPRWPYPDWGTNLDAVRRALRRSNKRRLFGITIL